MDITKVEITIETGSAAFDKDEQGMEIARILRYASEHFKYGGTDDISLRDYNGNTVGSVVVHLE